MDKPSWRGQLVCTCVGNKWNHGVVIARLRSSVWSLLHQHRDLHQSTYLYLSEDQEITSHHLVHGQDLCCPATSSRLGGACAGLDSCARLYIHTAKLVHGISVVTSILWPLTGELSSSSSTTSPNQDSSDDYPKIGISTYGDSTGEGCLIFMVAPTGDLSHNSSSRYATIGRSKAFDARTPKNGMIQNLNLDFNVMRLHTIMETIQRMPPEGSPLVALSHQGAEVADLVIAERSIGNPQREPSVGNNRAR
jgi:hypothetical protein